MGAHWWRCGRAGQSLSVLAPVRGFQLGRVLFGEGQPDCSEIRLCRRSLPSPKFMEAVEVAPPSSVKSQKGSQA
ncbi:hypothetical protein L7F22_017263, partial [Adiantum nelumboides]|nr:hypothetical protein [Adiantum nelumboides]